MKIERMILVATKGPFYVGEDRANDAPAHKDSGLALIDTGRHEDFPVARLMEWGNAKLAAELLNSAPALVELVKAATEFRDDYKQGKSSRTGSRGKLFQALAALPDEWREE